MNLALCYMISKILFWAGITGRLNGAGAEAFWGQSAPHANAQPIHHHSKMPVGPTNGAGWEEPSPPSQRRNMPNYDDGTSLWGNPQQGDYLFINNYWIFYIAALIFCCLWLKKWIQLLIFHSDYKFNNETINYKHYSIFNQHYSIWKTCKYNWFLSFYK